MTDTPNSPEPESRDPLLGQIDGPADLQTQFGVGSIAHALIDEALGRAAQ